MQEAEPSAPRRSNEAKARRKSGDACGRGGEEGNEATPAQPIMARNPERLTWQAKAGKGGR